MIFRIWGFWPWNVLQCQLGLFFISYSYSWTICISFNGYCWTFLVQSFFELRQLQLRWQLYAMVCCFIPKRISLPICFVQLLFCACFLLLGPKLPEPMVRVGRAHLFINFVFVCWFDLLCNVYFIISRLDHPNIIICFYFFCSVFLSQFQKFFQLSTALHSFY